MVDFKDRSFKKNSKAVAKIQHFESLVKYFGVKLLLNFCRLSGFANNTELLSQISFQIPYAKIQHLKAFVKCFRVKLLLKFVLVLNFKSYSASIEVKHRVKSGANIRHFIPLCQAFGRKFFIYFSRLPLSDC